MCPCVIQTKLSNRFNDVIRSAYRMTLRCKHYHCYFANFWKFGLNLCNRPGRVLPITCCRWHILRRRSFLTHKVERLRWPSYIRRTAQNRTSSTTATSMHRRPEKRDESHNRNNDISKLIARRKSNDDTDDIILYAYRTVFTLTTIHTLIKQTTNELRPTGTSSHDQLAK